MLRAFAKNNQYQKNASIAAAKNLGIIKNDFKNVSGWTPRRRNKSSNC